MFPLPLPTRQQYEKWNGYQIEEGTFAGYNVVWMGFSLSKLFGRHTQISTKNIFILKRKSTFIYAVHDALGFHEIPYRLYNKCFANVSAIPSNNRTTSQLYETLVETPYVPEKMWQSRAKRPHKKSKHTHPKLITQEFASWRNSTLSNSLPLMPLLAQMMEVADTTDPPLNPFVGYTDIKALVTNPEAKKKVDTIFAFIYHYCRNHLGLPKRVVSLV